MTQWYSLFRPLNNMNHQNGSFVVKKTLLIKSIPWKVFCERRPSEINLQKKEDPLRSTTPRPLDSWTRMTGCDPTGGPRAGSGL